MTPARPPLGADRGVLVARGVSSLVLGILVFAWPDVAVSVVVHVFAAYLALAGLAALWSASRSASPALARAPSVLQGALELAGGALTLALPDRAAGLLAIGVGLWAVAIAILVLWASAMQWRRVRAPAPLVLGSLLVGALGSLLAARPEAALAGADGLLGLISATAVLAGALLLLLAWSLRPGATEAGARGIEPPASS